MTTVRHVGLAYNNVYLVERSGERLLVDTGPDYRGAWEHLRASLGSGGDPDLVVATHGHQDHAGLGSAWQAAGARVAVGADDHAFTEQPEGHAKREFGMIEALLDTSGVEGEVGRTAREGLARRRRSVAVAREDYPPPGTRPRWPTGLKYVPYRAAMHLVGAELLPAGLKVLSSPGHTPGNLVLVQENEGWLFSGDQLLPDITPTPGLQLAADSAARFRSLPAFVRSLESLLTLDLVRCFPGHGEPFDDPAAVIRANLGAIEARTEKIYEEMRSRGPCRVFALCERLYPLAARKRFWQILPTVIGHLDLLEERGLVREGGGQWHA